MTMTDAPVTPGSPPDAAHLNALAIAFINLSSNNLALLKQQPIPSVDVSGLENANASLKIAQGNATDWDNTISGDVQNVLELIQTYNPVYKALLPELKTLIDALKKSTPSAPPPSDTIQSLVGIVGGLQQSIQQIYYGDGGTEDKPTENSLLYIANSLSTYKTNVLKDYTTFQGYAKLVTGAGSPLAIEIGKYTAEIASAVRSQEYDLQRQLAGKGIVGAGVVIGVIAVLAAPETGGTSLAFAGVGLGVAAAGAGLAMSVTNQEDYDKQAKIITTKSTLLTADKAEQALLPVVSTACGGVSKHCGNIVDSIGKVVNTWQQLDNLLGDMITALNLPEKDLNDWIAKHPQYKTKGGSGYMVLGWILGAHLAVPEAEWQKATDQAAGLLTALRTTKKVSLPSGTVATQQAIVTQMAKS